MTAAIDTATDFTDEEIRGLALAVDVLRRAPKLDAADRSLFTRLSTRLHDESAARGAVLPAFTLTMPLTVSEDDIPRPEGAKPKRPRAEGKKPFSLNLAPSLNVYSAFDPWVLEKARAEVDRRIDLAKAASPGWSCGSITRIEFVSQPRAGKSALVKQKLHVTGPGRRRIVEFTRCSSVSVDELAIDILGGKILIDRLVWAGILRGDTGEDIVRRGRWRKAPPKQGFVKLAVYEIPRET